jgi:hypothetical protein
VDRPTITYARRPDATPEAELTALAVVYRIVLGAKKEAAPESRPDDAEGPKNDRTATEILPKPS